MNLSEYIYVTSLPYSSLLKELNISGKLFSVKATCVSTCRCKPSPTGAGLQCRQVYLIFIGG